MLQSQAAPKRRRQGNKQKHVNREDYRILPSPTSLRARLRRVETLRRPVQIAEWISLSWMKKVISVCSEAESDQPAVTEEIQGNASAMRSAGIVVLQLTFRLFIF
jgi:hypothetical protein